MKKGLFTLLAIFAIAFYSTAQDITVEPVQMTLLTKKTATWCPPCGGWAWGTYENLLQNHSDKAVVMAAHFSTSGDPLYNATSEDLIDGFEYYPGRPVFYTNTAKINSFNGAQVETLAAEFINAAYAQTPVAQSGIAATVDFSTNIVTVNTKTHFFQAGEGEYYLATYLVDKEVIAEQAGQGNNALHKNVLRDELNQQPFGELLVSGSVAVGATFEKSFQLDVAGDIDLNNMSFVTIIWKKNGDVYDFVNTFKSDEITEAMPSAVERIFTEGEFSISPNVTSDRTVVDLTLNKNVNYMEVALFDLKGQKVQTIFAGNQVAGTHRLEVEKPAFAAGIYFVTLTINGESFAKKVVFK